MTSSNQTTPERPRTSESKNPVLTRTRMAAGAIALGGMIVGALVGIAVQAGIESTGLLGPSVSALIEEQEANFNDVNTRLQELMSQSSDPEVAKGLADLGKLLARQGELQTQANTELAYLGSQVANLKQQALDEQGFAGGADFWLKPGESVSVGDQQNVFGVVRSQSNFTDVSLNGKRARMTVGDTVSTDRCTVFFKQAVQRTDERIGFDLSCS